MSDAKGLTRQQMCDRLAMEFEDGWIVNLGIGIPTLCSNFDFGDKEIIFHAENGVIGYGPLTGAGREDLHLVNAGGQHVTLRPGAAIVHHADSFGLIRSGRIDETSANDSTCSTYRSMTFLLVREPAFAAAGGPEPSSTVSATCLTMPRPLSMPTGRAPDKQNLRPLYWAGLWDAVNIAPGASSAPAA